MSDKWWLPLILLVVFASIFTATEAKSQTIELMNFQDRWAILVGVGAYPESSGISPLVHPSDDVQKLKDVLITRGAFEPSNIEVLIDEQATRKGLEGAFQKLRSGIKANDLLLFYFSGRGARVSGLYADDEQDGLNECLLLYDSTRKSEGNFFRDAELGQLLNSLKAKRTVIIIDACYTAFNRNTKAITTSDDAAASNNQRDGIKNDYIPNGAMILEACAPDTETLDGVFTSSLVDTFRDDKAHGADGIITIQEAWEYLQTVLPNQRPQLDRIGVLKPISLIQPLIKITSQPSGAEIFVDNIQLLDESSQPAITPVSITLSVGEYNIKLQKWGYRIHLLSREVDAPGKQEPVPLKLEPVSIRGKLVYENSDKPIVDANVLLDPLEYETKTNNQGEFVFNDWEQYKIKTNEKYRVQVRDEKNRLPFREVSIELGKDFYEDKTIGTISLNDLAYERRMASLRDIGIIIAILIGVIAAAVWFLIIRPKRIREY